MLFRIISFFFSPFFAIFDPILSRFTNALTSKKTQRVAVKSIFIGFVAVTLLAIAFVAYLGFYVLYIPKIAHVKPIYLQYDKEPNSIVAEVDFTEGGKYSSVLTYDQAYDVSIDLYVPASESNIGLGNFMISLKLVDSLNRTVIESDRPCTLTYQSGLLRVVSTVWRLVPLILGFTKEDENLKISMIENMIEDSEKPVTKALISISNKQLNTYYAQIRLDAHFRGLRFFMYYHPVPTASIFMSLFLFVELFSSMIAWRLLVSWWQNNFQAHLIEPAKHDAQIGIGGGQDLNLINGQGGQGDQEVDEEEDYGAISDENKWPQGRRRNNVLAGRTEAENNGELTESDYETSRPESIISPTSELTNYPDDSHQEDEDDLASFTVTSAAEDDDEDDNDDEGYNNSNNNNNNNNNNNEGDDNDEENEQGKGGNILISSDDTDENEGLNIGSSTAAAIGNSSTRNARAYRRNVSGNE